MMTKSQAFINRAYRFSLAGTLIQGITTSAVLLLSATLGCLIPARRAMRVDPVVARRANNVTPALVQRWVRPSLRAALGNNTLRQRRP
jgi:hypothetical protein